MTNSKNIIKTIDELVKNLAVIRKSIHSQDEQTLTQIFTRAKEKRDAIISSNHVSPAENKNNDHSH